MGLPEQGQKRMMARKDFVAVHFPTLYQEWGGEGGGMFLQIILWQNEKKPTTTELDEEENFEISNHQKFMRHKMRQKCEEWLYPCLEDGRRMMEDDTAERKKIINNNKTNKQNIT